MKSTKEMIEVMQAFADGKKIYVKSHLGEVWLITEDPRWNWEKCDYKVAPEPKASIYRPYESVKEMLADYWKRIAKCNPRENEIPLIWVCNGNVDHLISGFDFDIHEENPLHIGSFWVSMAQLFNCYLYPDGTPCGKLVE